MMSLLEYLKMHALSTLTKRRPLSFTFCSPVQYFECCQLLATELYSYSNLTEKYLHSFAGTVCNNRSRQEAMMGGIDIEMQDQ